MPRFRRKRTDHLSAELFRELVWNLLLVLFIADSDGERLTAEDAIDRVDVGRAVGVRWMTALEALGLVACHERRDEKNVVTLAPKGVHAVEACMLDAVPIMEPRG